MNEAAAIAALRQTLETLAGPDAVLHDEASRTLYSQDIWQQGSLCALVLRPDNGDTLARGVAAITRAGFSLIARGGGMSYTGGTLPQDARTVVVDTARMNRVLGIHAEDMYVTVEAGCRWQTLHAALEPLGLRTPYWGTLSGAVATVGGSISQNSIFWGSGQHGSAADSLLGLEVVLADGSRLHTGSAAQAQATPFFRHFGPDLTGLFSCDSGALGIKASITLRLLPALPARGGLSFDFQTPQALLAAMAAIARRGLAMECWATDPTLSAQRAQRERLLNDVKALAGVLRASRNPWQALLAALRLAFGGRRFLRGVQWPLHVQVEDRNEPAVRALLAEARAIARRHGGRELPNTIPLVIRANPFPPVNNMVGPGGERWVPVHALVPHSKAVALHAAVEAIYARHREALKRHGVLTGYLFTTVGHGTMAIEPLYFWPDALAALHEQSVQAAYLQQLPRHAENLEARAFVGQLRRELIALFSAEGAAHLQLGKCYPYASALRPEALALVRGLKQLLDPARRINPGALGL